MRSTRILVGLVLASAFAGPPAIAQDGTPPAASAALCSYAGRDYKVGEFACIAACHGNRRLARCDAILDSASWTYVSDTCPSASLNPPWPSDWSEVPAAVAMTPVPLNVNMTAIAPAFMPAVKGARLSLLTR
jgi:hypothetical protein